MRIPSQERGCEGKIKLKANFRARVDRLAKKHGKQLGVYKCPHCNGFHTTTKIYKADQYSVNLLYITA